jgi:hypothetical protein
VCGAFRPTLVTLSAACLAPGVTGSALPRRDGLSLDTNTCPGVRSAIALRGAGRDCPADRPQFGVPSPRMKPVPLSIAFRRTQHFPNPGTPARGRRRTPLSGALRPRRVRAATYARGVDHGALRTPRRRPANRVGTSDCDSQRHRPAARGTEAAGVRDDRSELDLPPGRKRAEDMRQLVEPCVHAGSEPRDKLPTHVVIAAGDGRVHCPDRSARSLAGPSTHAP